MGEAEASKQPQEDDGASDLSRRLARLRRRVEAEGRPRSARLIDRAIEEAERKPAAKE